MSKECYVAELKYTDGERVEVGEAPSYVIVRKIKDDYGDGVVNTRFVNLFTGEEYPTFSRSSRIGQYYYDDKGNEVQVGCKLVQESTEIKEGPCYILTREKMENIPTEDIENMVIYSSRYFKDRVRIIERRGISNIGIRRIIFRDLKSQDAMIEYFNERGFDEFNANSNARRLIKN